MYFTQGNGRKEHLLWWKAKSPDLQVIPVCFKGGTWCFKGANGSNSIVEHLQVPKIDQNMTREKAT